MRVRIKTALVGNGTSYHEGDEVDLGDETAVAWIRAGHAERIPSEPETAEPRLAEKAVLHGGRRRG